MNAKILAASGAILLMALGSSVAEARDLGGGGGGGGGHSFSGGGGGGGRSFSGGGGGGVRMHGGGDISRSFRSGPNFRGNNFARGSYRRGPVVGWNGNRYGRHHHRRGPRFFVGYPYYYGDYYDYGYSGGCGWLYDRAVSTGSPYWWRRYEICAGEG